VPPIPRKPKSGIFLGGVGGPVASRPKKGAPIVITSGPGRPAPIEKQPLPAYGPYDLPLTDVEKRIVIRKRTPKFVETPRGRIATGGGGVGFFTKGDKSKIMNRVASRALALEDASTDRSSRISESALKRDVADTKARNSNPSFLEGLAAEVGLDDFYRDNVLPEVGKAFGNLWETTRETYGTNLIPGSPTGSMYEMDEDGEDGDVAKAFDYAANLVKGGAGIAKTKGFDPAKPYVASAIDTATSLGGRGVKAMGELDDYLQSEAPVYDSVKTWANRSVVKPGKNAVVEALSVVTNQPVNKRIDEASEEDKALIFTSNDVEQEGRETAATQEQRDLWVTMAMGEYDGDAWEGYKSPFTREQLERMSDYELINVAYGTHTSSIASIFEAAKNDLKKIGAMPAAIGALNNQIQEANDKGDYRGLGNMAEFIARQAVANMIALNQAGLWVMTAGQVGQYDDLVRALKAEPILTGLDVASTATIYGKAATSTLKTGGALTRAGALTGRVPGAVGAGETIARGATAVAARPIIGAPLRAAAATGRGARRIADTERVEVRDLGLEGARELGATPGPLRVFAPKQSFLAQSLALLAKRGLEADNLLGRFLSSRSVKSQSAVTRAAGSQRANVTADMAVGPVSKALDFVLKKKPELYDYLVYETSGASKIDLPGFEDTIDLSPAKRADQLEEVLEGRAWERTVTQRNADGRESQRTDVRYQEDAPEGEGWQNINLSRDERLNANTLVAQLRNVAKTPQKDIDSVNALLNNAYREEIGNVAPSRRLAGVPAQPGSELSLREILENLELGNIEKVQSLGVRINPNVADLPGRADVSVRERLKLGEAPGLSRRVTPGIARVQDETVVRLSPIVAPEYRRVVEEVLAKETESAAKDVARLSKAGKGKKAQADLAKAEQYQKDLLAASNEVDRYVDSLMRDAIEMSDSPMGGSVFYPTVKAKDAKEVAFAEQALAGRGSFRNIRNVHAGQFALLGDAEDINRFAGALARNLRVPVMAYEFVTSLTNYLARTGGLVKFSDDPAKFAEQRRLFEDLGYLNGDKDYRVLPVNDETGFLKPDDFNRINTEQAARVAGKDVAPVGLPEEAINEIISDAFKNNSLSEIGDNLMGRQVLIVNGKRWTALQKEIEEAAKSRNKLRALTRIWVRITLSTIPRTPIANILGSGLLGAIGGGLAGYGPARRLIRSGNVPPEIQNLGIAGQFGPEFKGLFPGQKGSWLRQYMDYIYSYNVKGEDMARLATWARATERGLKNSDEVAQLRKDIADAQELDAAMQKLLEAVAKGKFDDGRALTPELEQIRADALEKADDFLGGAQGLTSRQRWITTAVPFWMWYKHIFKLYFYTLPTKYSKTSLTMNAFARLGYEESARNGFYDSFYEDAIKIGEEERGSNIYSRGITTNIFPLNFGSVGEFDEGAPGVQFATSSVAPTLTVPLRLLGIGIPGAPVIGTEGERLKGGDVFAPGYAEAAASEFERLVAPVGLLQSAISPRSSIAFNIGRKISGDPIPEVEPRGMGTQYAVTPRGFSELGAPLAAGEGLLRAFGIGIARTPVRGPVAKRLIRGERERQSEEQRERVRESRR